MYTLTRKQAELYFYILLCSFLWIYLILRAIHVPLAHDEISTFHRYVHTGRFMPPGAHPDANNHVLNSALTWIFYSLFGASSFVLRLANLLSAPIFFYFWFRIASQLKHLAIRWIFLLSFICSTYFLEFFALSRGYGMSMALLAGGFWHVIRWLQEQKQRDRALSLIWLTLAVAANLTLVNTLLLVSGAMLAQLFFIKEKRIVGLLAILLLGFLPAAVYSLLLLHMKKLGLLYYGNSSGFWQLTVKSLAAVITESERARYPLYALVLFLLVLVLMLSQIIKSNFRWNELFHTKYLFTILLLGNLIAVILSAKLFHANYPEDRTGLYFFPFLVGSVCFLASDYMIKARAQDALWVMTPLLLLPVHFVRNLNLDHSSYYHEDTIPARFFDKVHKDQHTGDYPPSIGGYRQRQLCWYYLNFRTGGTGSSIHFSNYPDTTDEYQITRGKFFPKWQRYYDSLDYEAASDFLLLKRKQAVQLTALDSLLDINTHGTKQDEYFTLMEGRLDSSFGKHMEWRFDLNLTSSTEPFEAWVVVSLFDKNGQDAGYEYLALDWLRTHWNKEQTRLLNSLRVSHIEPRAVRYVLYVWNQRKVPYNISKGKVVLSRID